MIPYTSSFNYRTTARIASKTKDIKLLEETSRRKYTRLALKYRWASPCRSPDQYYGQETGDNHALDQAGNFIILLVLKMINLEIHRSGPHIYRGLAPS